MTNPHETIGKSGKGRLWNEGANYAADALILVEIDGAKHMVAIKRSSGHWAMPGGFRNKEEDPRAAAFRELHEDAGILFTPRAQAHAELAYEGYVIDPRNTDDAWIETSVYLLDLGGFPAPQLKAGDDAQDVCFLKLTKENVDALYPGHAKLVRDILEARGRDVCEDCFTTMMDEFALDQDDHASMLTEFLNEIFSHVMNANHAHQSYLLRLNVLLLLLEDVSRFIRSRAELKMSDEDRALAVARFRKFVQGYQLASAPDHIDKALEMLPELYEARRAMQQETRRPAGQVFAFSKNPGTIN